MARADCRRPWTRMSMPHTGGTQPHSGRCLRGCLEVQQQQKRNAEAAPPSPGLHACTPVGAAQQSTLVSSQAETRACTGPSPRDLHREGKNQDRPLALLPGHLVCPGCCTGITTSPCFPGRCSVTPLSAELCHMGESPGEGRKRAIG